MPGRALFIRRRHLAILPPAVALGISFTVVRELAAAGVPVAAALAVGLPVLRSWWSTSRQLLLTEHIRCPRCGQHIRLVDPTPGLVRRLQEEHASDCSG
ncbi:hypothetical protein [Streptomyces xiamenensis]|uniref:hypothetical protein n=1 Tax=Streptomyces xiamenensis TaxID=408015 RepID=UPI0035D6FEC6